MNKQKLIQKRKTIVLEFLFLLKFVPLQTVRGCNLC